MKNKLFKIQYLINKILSNKFATDLIYGLPIFHTSKGHQGNIKPHIEFLNHNSNYKIGNFYLKVKNYVKSLFVDKKIFYSKNIKYQKFDVFLLSNIISDRKVKDDYIFGDLADYLNKNDVKTLTIFKNFSNINSKKINNSLRRPFVILSNTIGVLGEIALLYNLFLVSNSIKLLMKKINNKKIKIFLNQVNRLKNIIPIISNIRLYYQINFLIKKYQPNVIVFTFENHAWERYLIKKIKSNHKNIKTLAYQFTTISKDQYTKFSKKDYEPDFVLSSGSKIYSFLSKVFKKKTKVLNFGSYRQQKIITKKNNQYDKKFLLVPEAPISEAYDFMSTSIDLAKKFKNCRFTLRLHPMSKSKELVDKINYKTKNLKNFTFSSKSIDKDLYDNSYIIHRASSLSITAALSGLIPIYLSDVNFNLDPLFLINKKYILKSNDDLKKILLFSKKENIIYQKKVISFCKKYFEKPNYKKNLRLFNYLNQTMI